MRIPFMYHMNRLEMCNTNFLARISPTHLGGSDRASMCMCIRFCLFVRVCPKNIIYLFILICFAIFCCVRCLQGEKRLQGLTDILQRRPGGRVS